MSVQGVVPGNLVNDGMLDLSGTGVTGGALVVQSNYTQGPTGVLSLEIGGSLPNEMDQLTVLGAAMLDGTLDATLEGGFTPSVDTNLPVLSLAHPAVGGFSSVISPSNNGVVTAQPVAYPDGLGLIFGPPGPSVSVTTPNVPEWQPEGPSPINGGQTSAHPDNGQVGAISDVLVTPSGTVYIGTVNGGVWSSNQVTPSWLQVLQDHYPFQPPNFWVPLTDNQPSLAVSTMALDPNDPNNTLWVGTGSLSSYGNAGGPAVGLLKTTNGGQTWANLAGTLSTPITGASNTDPIVITTASTAGLIAGSELSISGVNGNTAANGTWAVGNVTPTSFTLTGSFGSGKFTKSPSAAWTSSIYGDTVLSLVPTGTTDLTTGQEVVLVGTNGQGLWRSTDGGANFAPATFILTNGTSYTNSNALNAFTATVRALS